MIENYKQINCLAGPMASWDNAGPLGVRPHQSQTLNFFTHPRSLRGN